MAGRIRTRVSLVIQLIDDFNNNVIRGSGVRVWIPGEKPPVKKPEGYYVFSNLPDRRTEIVIESGMYERQTVLVEVKSPPHVRSAESAESPPHVRSAEYLAAAADGSYTMLKIRLMPGRAYVLPPGTTCVQGTAEPGSQIRIFCRDEGRTLKLLHDYTRGGLQGGEIGIYHPDDMDIEGKTLYIQNRDCSEHEYFRISRSWGAGGYQLPGPLAHDYKKIGTTIYPVQTAVADAQGYYSLPLLPNSGRSCECICEAAGTKRIVLIRALTKGIVNRLDFTKEDQ